LSSTARQIIFWLLIIAGALLIYKLVNPGSKNTAIIDLTQLDDKIKKEELKELVVKQTEVVAIDKAGTNVEYHVALTEPQRSERTDEVRARTRARRQDRACANGQGRVRRRQLLVAGALLSAPFLLIFGFWIFMLRQMQSAATRRCRLANREQSS
jgi:ATP-dependent Zn protease